MLVETGKAGACVVEPLSQCLIAGLHSPPCLTGFPAAQGQAARDAPGSGLLWQLAPSWQWRSCTLPAPPSHHSSGLQAECGA